MKYRVLLFVMFCCLFLNGLQATAQSVYLVIAADVKATDIGLIAAIDQANIEYLFRTNVPDRQLNVTKIAYDKMSPEGIGVGINAMELTNDDILVFYYSGHSSFDIDDLRQFFKLPYGKLYRDELMETLHKKSARLTVLLSDCCNTPRGKNVVQALDYHPPEASRAASPLFNTLFFRNQGTVDLTSSKLGEYSVCDIRSSGNHGSCFTWAMIELMTENRDNNGMNWNEFVTELTPIVAQAFRNNYPDGFGDQRTQTVTALAYPGMKPKPRPRPLDAGQEKFRFGARVLQRPSGGFVVLDVFDGSPAYLTGLEPGDIILEFDGVSVNSDEEFAKAIDKAGEEMDIKLIDVRTRKTMIQKVRLQK